MEEGMMFRSMKPPMRLFRCSLWGFAIAALEVLSLWGDGPFGLQGVMEPSRTCWWHLVFLAESSYVWPFGLLHDISDKNFGLNRGYCYMLNAPFILQRAGPMLYLSSWKQTSHVGRWGGKCAKQLPVLSAARFPARAGEGRIQSKI